MAESIGTLLIVCLAGLAVYLLLRPRTAFVIHVRAGHGTVRSGRIQSGFVTECERICTECGIDRATVRGCRTSGRVLLRFSRSVPKNHRQHFRNAFSFYV